jgi:hypothetical protein
MGEKYKIMRKTPPSEDGQNWGIPSDAAIKILTLFVGVVYPL